MAELKPLLSVEEALARVTDGLAPTGTETVPLAQARGRVLAADLAAQRERLFESWRPREALAPQARQEFQALYDARIQSIESWL